MTNQLLAELSAAQAKIDKIKKHCEDELKELSEIKYNFPWEAQNRMVDTENAKIYEEILSLIENEEEQ